MGDLTYHFTCGHAIEKHEIPKKRTYNYMYCPRCLPDEKHRLVKKTGTCETCGVGFEAKPQVPGQKNCRQCAAQITYRKNKEAQARRRRGIYGREAKAKVGITHSAVDAFNATLAPNPLGRTKPGLVESCW